MKQSTMLFIDALCVVVIAAIVILSHFAMPTVLELVFSLLMIAATFARGDAE